MSIAVCYRMEVMADYLRRRAQDAEDRARRATGPVSRLRAEGAAEELRQLAAEMEVVSGQVQEELVGEVPVVFHRGEQN